MPNKKTREGNGIPWSANRSRNQIFVASEELRLNTTRRDNAETR